MTERVNVSPPNILLILTDQQTAGAMSAFGNANVRTPNMDRLVREGVTFERSYCVSPVCGPSRTSLYTGLPVHRHGYTHHFADLDWQARGITSFAPRLQEAGYATHWIGKWHAHDYVPQAPEIGGFTNHPATKPGRKELGWDMDPLWTDLAVDFLRAPHTQPFFLGLSLLNPHDICYWIMNTHADITAAVMPEEGAELPPLPPNFRVDPAEPEIMRHRRTMTHYGPEVAWTKQWCDHDWRRYLFAYYRLVEAVDYQIGRALDALDAAGLKENTLVIFTSDHGEGSAAHRLVVKLSPYEEAVRVPLVLRYPIILPAGRTVTNLPVSGLDIAPTILDFAGALPSAEMPGMSLSGAARGEETPARDFVVCALYPDQAELDRESRIVCTAQHKLVLAIRQGDVCEQALYDLGRDPGELHNIADHHDSHETLAAMHGRLHSWMSRTADPLLPRAKAFWDALAISP